MGLMHCVDVVKATSTLSIFCEGVLVNYQFERCNVRNGWQYIYNNDDGGHHRVLSSINVIKVRKIIIIIIVVIISISIIIIMNIIIRYYL